jgi:four helix bundle protein
VPREASYRDLVVWQKSRLLVGAVYRATQGWPVEERYLLTNQVRRAAISIPANIAEGQGRLGKSELKHHLSIAHGSLCELEALLQLAEDNGLMDLATFNGLSIQTSEVGRLLRGFIRSLDKSGQ